MMTKTKDWFSIKSYPHIGLPITWQDYARVKQYITNPKNIETHAFCPFIHTQITTPKFRKEYDSNGNLLHNGKRVAGEPKKRNIYYVNHWDANIFAYYSYLLSQKYEQLLKDKNLGDVVSAYRQIPKDE